MNEYDEEFWGEALWADELEPGFGHAVGGKGGEPYGSRECHGEDCGDEYWDDLYDEDYGACHGGLETE